MKRVILAAAAVALSFVGFADNEGLTPVALPADYLLLNGASSDGHGQYVDTEYVFMIKPAVVCGMKLLTATATPNKNPLGTPSRIDGCFDINFDSSFYYRYGKTSSTIAGIPSDVQTALLADYTPCAFSNEVWMADKKILGPVTGDNFPVNTQTFLIYTGNNNPMPVGFSYVKMYDNGVLVRDYLPCKDPSGTVGLWDSVEGKFKASAANGSLVADGEGVACTLVVEDNLVGQVAVAPVSGNYFGVSGAVEFVAPSSEQLECRGAEIYEFVGGAWSRVETKSGNTFTLTLDAAKRTKVSWLWKAALGMNEPKYVSSGYRTALVSAQVTGIGKTASEATLTFAYGTAEDALDESVAVTVSAAGEWRATLQHLAAGVTYFVKATLTNDAEDEPVVSEAIPFDQPECDEPGLATSSNAYAQKDHLVAFWDGYDNVALGEGDRSATTWTDISGHGFDWTLADGTYEWTDRGLWLKNVGRVGSLATKTGEDFKNKVKTVEFVYANKQSKHAIIFAPGFGSNAYLYTDANNRVGFHHEKIGTTVALNSTNCFSVIYSGTGETPTGVANFCVNGAPRSNDGMGDLWSSGLTEPVLGDRMASAGLMPANGELFAIRIYDVELTAAEREQNYRADFMRYLEGRNPSIALQLTDGRLTLTVPASSADRTATFYWGETYGGTNEWDSTSGAVTIPAGATTVSCPKPTGWGSSVRYARVKVGEGDAARWSKTLEPEPPAPIGMNAQLSKASSEFGSSDIAATVTGIGTTASKATLTFKYGTERDSLDGEVTVQNITDAGEWRGTIPHCIAGQTYYVQATLSNDVADVVTSAVFEFDQPELDEPGAPLGGRAMLELKDGQLVLTMPAFEELRSAVLCWGATYGGVDDWAYASTPVTIPAGATTVSFDKPDGWGKTVWYARVKVGEGENAVWSKTLVAEPPAPLGVEKPTYVSSEFGSSVVAANVTGIGKTASEATLAFHYGTTPTCADGTVEVTVTAAGEWRGTIPHLIAGQTYYVRATVSNDIDDPVTSEPLDVLQPTFAERLLPLGYAKVEYVESSGNQYVDTGVYGHDNIAARSKMLWKTVPSDDGYLGVRASGDTRIYLIYSASKWTTCYGSWTPGSKLTIAKDVVYDVETIMKPGERRIVVDGVEAQSLSSTADISVPYTFSLFGMNSAGSVSKTSARCYSLQIWEYGVLTRDYVPCYSDADAAYGLYDLVNGTFSKSATATALLGSEIPPDERGIRVLSSDAASATLAIAKNAADSTLCRADGTSYGGEDVTAWGSVSVLGTVAASDANVVQSAALGTGWGENHWVSRFFVVTGTTTNWSDTVLWQDPNLPQATLADARALGLETFVLSGTLDAFVGESCTVTPIVLDSTGAAIDFSAAAQAFDAPGEFSFALPAAIAEDETYSICVEMTANGRAARSKTIVVKTGTAGMLTPLADGATAPIVVTVEDDPDGLTTVAPSYGRYAAEANKVYTFTTTASQTIDGRAYALAGYAVYDDGADEPAASGEGNAFTFASDRGGFRVVWRWDVLYTTTLEVSGGNGTALANQPSVKHGETARFTATPDEGYAVAWTGEGVPNELMFGNELVIENMTGPVHVVASFFQPSENPSDAEKTGLFATYAHAQFIDFAGYAGESTLTNFPALIRLGEGTGGFSYAACAADGRDVRFCGADGQELASEVVKFDKNDTSEFWVKVPRLTNMTRIFVVWGNADAEARPFGMSAWDESFLGSWSFDAGANLLVDRSPRAMHGTVAESEVDTVDGVVGKARHFRGNVNSRGWLGSGVRTDLEPSEFTAECWFKVESLPADYAYFLNSETRGGYGVERTCVFGVNSDGYVFGRFGGTYVANSVALSASAATVGAWHHAVLTRAANGTTTVCLDGVEGAGKASGSVSDWGRVAANPFVAVLDGDNAYPGKFRYYAGDLDEMRLSSVDRSADWVRASYETVAANDTFAVFGGAASSLTVDGEARPLSAAIAAGAPSVAEADGVRTTCVGHELVVDGKLLVSNEQLAVACNWPKDAKTVAVRWLRQVEYEVNGAFVPAGSSVTLTADAAPAGEAFHSWSGDCPELETFSPSFDLPADRPRTVTAVYAPLTEVSAVADDPEASGAALKAAVEAAVAAGGNRVVEVVGGEYLLTAKTSVTTPVVVRAKAGETPHIAYKASPFAFSAAGSALIGLTMEKGVAFGGNILSFSNGACMLDCVLDDKSLNTAYSRAEGVSMNGGWMRRSVVRNVSRHDDRGLTLESTLVDSCVLTNLAGNGKSAIACNKKTTIRNTIIARNHPNKTYNGSHNGGGLAVASGVLGVRLENCTIADNTNWLSGNSALGGGLYAAQPVVVVNTVFSGNAAHATADGDDFSGPIAALNSISKQFTSSDVGCKSAAAVFLEDEDGAADRVTYKPAASSPARNAGSATAWARTQGAWDLLGKDRVGEGVVDVGAVEFYPTGAEKLSVGVEMDKTTGRDTLEVTFTANVLDAKGNVTYSWEFGDGAESDEPAPKHTYQKPGFYVVSLTVKDESGAEAHFALSDQDKITVLPSVCYINKDGTHEPPYATRETGAEEDIQQVLAYSPSKIVICSNSTMKGSATIGYPIMIAGEDRETSVIGVPISVTDTNIVLSTLTITYDNYYGNTMDVSGALLTNVVVRKVRPPHSGHGALVLKDGARIVDSHLVENYVGHNDATMQAGTSAIEIGGAGVVVDRCIVSSNASGTVGGVYAAGIFVADAYDPMPVVRNSFIGYNRCFDKATKTNAVGGAGIYANGPVRVENCTIVSNQTCGAGSAVYVKAGAAEIVNTIIASNAGGLTNAAEICSNEVYVAEGASISWTRSRVPAEAGISGEEVTTADPKFNFGARKSEPYWSILGNSPCKNKGEMLDWMTPESTDLSGQRRVFNAKPDLGCYESQIGGTVIIVR